ncbi:MAG: hypothetical protein KJ737_18440 [Proteobacteria bacterium]|nr:hypothetical protein [Pseudomonadota bacterium]
MILIIEEFIKELACQKGVDLSVYAGDFLLGKIKSRMPALQIKTARNYLKKLQQDPIEADCLLERIGINDRSIEKPIDRNGKKIGVTIGSNGEYFLDMVLTLNSLS